MTAAAVDSRASLCWPCSTPFVGALLIPLFRQHAEPARDGDAGDGGALCLVAFCLLGPCSTAPGRKRQIIAGRRRASTLAFKVEPLGMLFALVASSLWIVNSIYSIGYMRANARAAPDHVLRLLRRGARQHDRHRVRQEPVHAVPVLRGADALDLSAGHAQAERGSRPRRPHLSSAPARHVARCCSCRRSSPPGCSPARSTSRPAASSPARPSAPVIGVLLALYVFGIGKAAVMPLHFWLPAAMVAPTPVSALLHAVAVVKAGVFTILKVIVSSSASMHLSCLGQSAWLRSVAGTTVIVGLPRRAPAGQPQAPARLFDRLAALLRRARRRDPGADFDDRRGHAYRRARRRARSRCSSPPARSTPPRT